MKNIIFILILTILSLEAKPCETDIYFGNGVWNTQKQGEEGRDELKRFMQDRAITPLSIEDEKNKLYEFKHAYNYSGGTNIDLIETFWQLKESGQIDEGYFQMIAATLATKDGADSHKEIMDEIRYVTTYYEDNVDIMFDIYKNSSFNLKHNVLLVAHSQGNLFGNKMYTLMNDIQKKKFRMVSVATPANHVAGDGPYVTAKFDYVIGPIPGSLPGNVDGLGHEFIKTYLNSSINAPRKIALHVKSAYDNLMQTTSCTEYTFVRVLMLSFGNVKIFGRPVGQGYGEDFISEVSLEQSDATFNSSTNKWQCGGQTTLYSNTVGSDGVNWAWGSYADEFGEVYSGAFGWLPGRLHSYDELQSRSTIKEEMLLVGKNQCVTMSLKKESLLYSAIEKIFPKK